MSSAVGVPAKPVVLLPLICPVCTGENQINLIELSRKGGMTCVACKKWLRQVDVMRARHAPRKPTSG